MWIALVLLVIGLLAVNYVGGGEPRPPCSETSALVADDRQNGTEERW